MASGTVTKLAAVVPLLIIVVSIILSCVMPASASRIDDNAPTTTATNWTFLPMRGGVVMIMNNKTARRAEDECSDICTDEKCQAAHPSLCGPHPDPNYCWVGCFCTGDKYDFCTCLCTQ